ncbi:MAG TPA: hypothetical protein VN426_06060 [Syntrophomonadaceae bacterium]|nr:hypothetical protein [Syntrophomonadaceae bacterium]
MKLVRRYGYYYIGTSAEPRPARSEVADDLGDELYEKDTGKVRIFDGDSWVPKKNLVQLTGSNEIIGVYSFAFASGATNPSMQSVPLPEVLQVDALYLVTVDNPAALGVAMTFELDNYINFGAVGGKYCMLTSEVVPSGGDGVYLAQGWLLGDADAQLKVTPVAATATAGTVTVQVRKV